MLHNLFPYRKTFYRHHTWCHSSNSSHWLSTERHPSVSQIGQYINQRSLTPSHSFFTQMCLAQSLSHKSSCQPAVFVGFLTPWCVSMWFPNLCAPLGLPTLLKQTALIDQQGDPSLSPATLIGIHCSQCGGKTQAIKPCLFQHWKSVTGLSVWDSNPSCMWQSAESFWLIKASHGLQFGTQWLGYMIWPQPNVTQTHRITQHLRYTYMTTWSETSVTATNIRW